MAKKRRKSKAKSRRESSHDAGAEAGTDALPASDDRATADSAAATTPTPPPSEEHTSRRKAANAFIFAFLAFQIAMPLRYYLGGGGYDERFSWRMFSSVRMQRCKVDVVDLQRGGGTTRTRDVDLASDLHVAWIRILERARPAAVRKYLRRRCESEDVTGVRYLLHCIGPDGGALPDRTVELDCDSGELTDNAEAS